MKFAAIASFVLLGLTLAGAPLRAQSQAPSPAQPAQPIPVDQEPHHHLMYGTSNIQVYDVLILPGQSALMYPQNIDYISITLAKSKVSVDSPGESPLSLDLPEGAVSFNVGGSAYTLTNYGSEPYHALSLAFLNTALTGRGCRCTGGPTDAICNCPGAAPLPPDWSLTIGHVFLRGVTLAPGATYDNDSTDTTRFLVAVTPFDVLDNTTHEPKSLQVRLPAGRFHWLGTGPHEIQNLASTPLRFVCVEF
ncbi:MAG TPA: hypothetical protein VNJ12_02430 [Candidatus Dormibacteraeota bacterium]|nr:hypothetical protein [Candidatus Dormibacteraeota bacterium]